MNKSTAIDKLNEASRLIFEVEKAVSRDVDNPTRKEGFRTRIKLGQFFDLIKARPDNISFD